MKTVGICWRRRVNSRWRSGPDIPPGIRMSRTRHLVSWTRSDARNASAEEKARAAKPNSRSRSGSDSRTDSSSSMTVTRARSAIIARSSPWPARPLVMPASCAAARRSAIIPWYRRAFLAILAHPPGQGVRQDGEHERGAWSVILLYPETTVMSLDYRAADGQPDTHAAALGRVERIEQLVHGLRLDADTGIPHGHAHTILAVSFGSDQ